MNIKECYVSHNGITCFTNINTLHNIKEIYINNNFINIRNKLLFYFSLRLAEVIITDIITNKDLLFIKNNDPLALIIFE
tara:strand:+ start:1626 stop:1862 length:237 start_codon:yes stop_codon:yes gene_type:complete